MTSITVPQAIRNAIETEKSAAAFYRSLLGRANDPTTEALLDTMARDEDAHAHQLEQLAEQLSAGPLPQAADDLAHLVECTAPISSGSGISFVKALCLALDAEHHAAHFYAVVAEATSGTISELFTELEQVERRHARNIERLLEETTARGD